MIMMKTKEALTQSVREGFTKKYRKKCGDLPNLVLLKHVLGVQEWSYLNRLWFGVNLPPPLCIGYWTISLTFNSLKNPSG